MTSIVKWQRYCEVCNSLITSKYGKRFCSPTCRAQVLNRIRWGPQKTRHCNLCGSVIQNLQAKQFCSIQCRNKAMAQRAADRTRKPKPAPKKRRTPWSNEAITYLKEHYATDGCEAIAQQLNMPITAVRNKAGRLKLRQDPATVNRVVYEKSRQRMIADNPMKHPEAQQKVLDWWENNPDKAQARSEQFLKGKQRIQKTRPNKLEQKLHSILDIINIPYEPYALIKPKFIVDIRIGKLIIQADGEYWHGHPRFDPLTERQQRQRQRDSAQDAYLTSCGYTVVRIWERNVQRHIIEQILYQHRDILQNNPAPDL